jgi:hypothetical protein
VSRWGRWQQLSRISSSGRRDIKNFQGTIYIKGTHQYRTYCSHWGPQVCAKVLLRFCDICFALLCFAIRTSIRFIICFKSSNRETLSKQQPASALLAQEGTRDLIEILEPLAATLTWKTAPSQSLMQICALGSFFLEEELGVRLMY